MDKEKVLEIIGQAAKEKQTEMDLRSSRLTKLPPEIGQLTNLRVLYLGDNLLTALPPEIGHLTNLTRLNLRSNQLATLPSQIGQLTKLKILFLGSNQLTALPPEIGKLTNLREIDLRYNQIVALPSQIGQLTNLEGLYLDTNQLRALPPEVGQLANLKMLYLDINQLTALPLEIGQLANLKELYLRSNQLTKLPPEIGQLTKLRMFYLDINQLTEFPPEIGQLTNLTHLGLRENRLTAMPSEIGKLTNLTALGLRSNQLTTLPPEVGQLTKLKKLYLHHNQLMELPPEIGQLTELEHLRFDNNPLESPPPQIVEQGTKAILAYLRERLEAGRRQWISKMLIVGEGGVGKTSLVRALRGEPFVQGLETTHGVQIDTLELKHPIETGVTMQLNCWDFGGQQIYHATHQFFLTNRSLFMLVWDARQGYEQGKLYHWLDAIESRAPESPILIVAAWTDERDADLPLADLKKKYPKIVGHYEVSNKTGAGIEEVRYEITSVAKDLPLMGEEWPADWLDAAEALRASEKKYIAPSRLREIMAEHGVSDESRQVLSRWLHELGDILYFQDDDELNDIVILKPQWVTEYISKVLESKEVIAGGGIFTSAHMREVWSDLMGDMQDHFLRLMERFDLSYRTLENKEISLVVERLSLDPPPDYEQKWDAIKEAGSCREVAMTFKLNTIPAGIPTWFIARSHRFTTHTHWRSGAVFADGRERRHLALVQADSHNRCIQLSVRGPTPYNLLALLRDGLEVTLDRFPGLDIVRTIPCPGHKGQSCEHEFNYKHLQKAIERDPPRLEIECPVALESVSVAGLLFGLDWRVQDEVLKRIDELEKTVVKEHDQTRLELRELRELAQREFLAMFRREQSVIDSHCPNVFVLRPRDSSKWKNALVGQKIELQLYCQAPGEWHPATDGGLYQIDDPAKWVKASEPYISKMVGLLKYAAPLAGLAVGYALPGIEEVIGSDIKLMTELVKKLPDLEKDRALELAEEIGEAGHPERMTGAALRTVRALLDEKDPAQHWGGLKKILTPEGHYLWLCEHHTAKYRI